MSYSRIEDALERMTRSSETLAALPFANTHSFSRALEPHHLLDLLREAEPHELSLFESDKPGPSELVAEQLERLRLGRSINGKWDVPKGRGPLRRSMPDQPSPLKKRHVDKDDPERYLLAAARLLDVYHLPRAKEHVDKLLAEYERLLDSLNELEAEQVAPSSDTAAAVEAAIQREELEIMALQDANAELQRKIKIASRPPPKPRSRLPSRRASPEPAPPAPVPEPVVAPPPIERTPEPAPPPVALPQPTPIVVTQPAKAPSPAPASPLASQADLEQVSALCLAKLASSLPSAAAEGTLPPQALLSLLAKVVNDSEMPAKDRAECSLARLLLEAYSQPVGAAPLRGQLVDPATRTGQIPMFPMSALKDAVAAWCRSTSGMERDAASQLPTKAIYALVAKGLLRIDRRSKDALVYFSPASE